MRKLYLKLALSGIKNNRQIYIPYILSCIGTVMVFFITHSLATSETMESIRGGSTITSVLALGSLVIAFFSLIFLTYTNSFISKKRNKEYGLYNILGMDKRTICKIVKKENTFVFLVSMIVGIVLGTICSKFSEYILLHMIKQQAEFNSDISIFSLIFTVFVFTIIFYIIRFKALFFVKKSNVLSLMNSEKEGEKPVKANALFAIIGLIILNIAYIIAIFLKDPIGHLSVSFMVAMLVVIATYILFIAGSVFLCKKLQSNKNYYYKKEHFISVSLMTYRMKRNGAGLASICLLCTMVLVTIVYSASLYLGVRNLGIDAPKEELDSLLTTFGGVFFVGILFSIVFSIAMALIIYYKQISEGYEDRSQYEILSKVGMSDYEIKKSINSQILTVFFVPLVMAGIHLIIAFVPMWKILKTIGLTNVGFGIIVLTAVYLIICVLYVVIYMATARSYFNIVAKNSYIN